MSLVKKLEKYIVSSNSSIRDALEKVLMNQAGIVIVVDNKNRLCGVLTDGDFRRWVLKEKNTDLSECVMVAANSKPIFARQGEVDSLVLPSDVDIAPVVNQQNVLVDIVNKQRSNFTLGKLTLSKNEPCITIAEIGNNHNGSKKLAFKLIDEAKRCGADVVKFQMRDLEEMNRESISGGEDLGVEYTNNLLSKYNLNKQDMLDCFDYANKIGIEVICTPFDISSLNTLIKYGISAIKIASADLTNHPLLKVAAQSRIPLIISTGMSTESELQSAVDVLHKHYANYILLHCNSTYPSPYKDINLKYMAKLEEYSCAGLVGYSGHERGYYVPLAAVAMGAKVIEKHFTIDKGLEGNDHKVSLLPEEFGRMVGAIRIIEESLGNGLKKNISQGELINRETLAKSIVAARSIEKGEVLKIEMVEFKSPGRGLQPDKIDLLLNKRINRDIARHEFIYEDDVEGRVPLEKNFKFCRPFGIPVRYHDCVELIKESNVNLIEFHLSCKDLSYDIRQLQINHPLKKVVVHSPELFENDHVLNLASNDRGSYLKSLDCLKRVVEATHQLKSSLLINEKIEVVLNVGGFSETGFLSDLEKGMMYDQVENALQQMDSADIEFLIQTMPPYPWHFGGQRYHNLFVSLDEIKAYCSEHSRRICLDISHSAMAAEFLGLSLSEYVRQLASFIGHIHLSDSLGLSEEGLQIGDGEICFENLVEDLNVCCPNVSFIPEIWQGHKNNGKGFYKALSALEKFGLR